MIIGTLFLLVNNFRSKIYLQCWDILFLKKHCPKCGWPHRNVNLLVTPYSELWTLNSNYIMKCLNYTIPRPSISSYGLGCVIRSTEPERTSLPTAYLKQTSTYMQQRSIMLLCSYVIYISSAGWKTIVISCLGISITYNNYMKQNF